MSLAGAVDKFKIYIGSNKPYNANNTPDKEVAFVRNKNPR
jgi:hypothetical protein